jgi:hypothetical protein
MDLLWYGFLMGQAIARTGAPKFAFALAEIAEKQVILAPDQATRRRAALGGFANQQVQVGSSNSVAIEPNGLFGAGDPHAKKVSSVLHRTLDFV